MWTWAECRPTSPSKLSGPLSPAATLGGFRSLSELFPPNVAGPYPLQTARSTLEVSGSFPEPVVPAVDAVAPGGRQRDDVELRVHLPGVGDALLRIEADIGHQVDLVQDHQLRGAEHLRILQR